MLGIFKKTEQTSHCNVYATEEELKEVRDMPAQKNRTKKQMDTYYSIDAENFELSKDFKIEYSVFKRGDRAFVRIHDVDFCADYVSAISITEYGSPPYASISGRDSVFTYACTNSTITVTLLNGRSFPFVCNRHCTEYVLGVIRDAIEEALE